MPEAAGSFLIIPAAAAGEGMGHLSRCMRLARELGDCCTIYAGCLGPRALGVLQAESRDAATAGLPGSNGAPRRNTDRIHVRHMLHACDHWDVVLVDKRQTSHRELEFYSRFGTVVGLDEGGGARRAFPYLVDILPCPADRPAANISSASLLGLPAPRKPRVEIPFRKVLVSFGGEDRAGLTGRLLGAVLHHGLLSPEALTVVEGPLFERTGWPAGIRVLRGLSTLREILPGHDLLITHFGTTALEAMAGGVPVLLLNPSPYHKSLGDMLGIPEIGVNRVDVRKLSRLLQDPLPFISSVEAFQCRVRQEPRGGLATVLKGTARLTTDRCPLCGAARNPVIGRFPHRTYYRCVQCGIAYLRSFSVRDTAYGEAYFGEQYKRQYGKTYVEDFPSIKKGAVPRIAIIKRLLGGSTAGTVLDVGCAFGPFLDALREEGFSPFGVDVSREAVSYVRSTLRIPAACRAFEELERSDLPASPIVGITFWYVLEHFRDLGAVLLAASALLSPGGVLAFSTPNGRGISARKDMRSFLGAGPSDHFTILSPRGLAGLLKTHGFSLRVVRITGHHPERFPGLLGRLASADAPASSAPETPQPAPRRGAAFSSPAVRALVSAASRLFGLGDTFEAYAVKEP